MNKIITSQIIIAVTICLTLASCRNDRKSGLLAMSGDKVKITSDDTSLVRIFNWALSTSAGYAGNDSDPAGPWYEAALPGREAFCIRDVSHQCISAEITGLKKQNLNMFRKFVSNISEQKDYCSFWEINRYNKPAPVDYSSDEDFWYNLNANFDIIDACWKLFKWTGDSTYIFSKDFNEFFRLTLNQYIRRWQLQPDSIMIRPPFMNFSGKTMKYRYSRGIPSYDESQENITVSSDLLGMISNGFKIYANILDLKGSKGEALYYRNKASAYLHLLDSLWWDEGNKSYFDFYNPDKKFYHGTLAGSEFLLWYDLISDPERAERSLKGIKNTQVEVLSYLPLLYYRNGFYDEGYKAIQSIAEDKRRSYPEASAGVIEGIVSGLMGIEPVSYENRIVTCPRLRGNSLPVTIENLPVFSGHISVRHESEFKTVFANKSAATVKWRAVFPGSYNKIKAGKISLHASHFTDRCGNIHSFADIDVGGGTQMTAEVDNHDIARNSNWPDLEEVILVWKTHCDIGYTHPVPEVLDYYRTGMMDGALKLIEDTTGIPKEERFVWMLPAWVMEVILDDKQDPGRKERIENAIRAGRIIWHALPFTFESEAADLEELVRDLESGTRLAKRFHQPLPDDAKLTDMPSQAWVLPTLLSKAGIKFVHIGVNPWSPNPAVPNLFWWEGPDGSRVLTGYSFHNYSWAPLPPAGWPYRTWLCLQVTGDNSGPPSPEQVKEVLAKIHKELPGVRVRFGRPADFAKAIINENRSDIPVIRGDMPDTWTHGQMTMPVATKIHRSVAPALSGLGLLSTELNAWHADSEDITATLDKAYNLSCMYSEHTWGIAGPSFGSPDHKTWEKKLKEGKYDSLLSTFKWHADYAIKAADIQVEKQKELMRNLALSVKHDGERIVVFNPLPGTVSGIVNVEIPGGRKLPSSVKDISDGREFNTTSEKNGISFFAADIPPGGYRTYLPEYDHHIVPGKISSDTFETNYFIVKIDRKRGGISSLIYKPDGSELIASGEHVLGQFMHERFSKNDVDNFLKEYCQVFFTWYGFPYYDFNKPKLDPALSHLNFTPGNWSLDINRSGTGYKAVMTTKETAALAGSYSTEFFFPDNKPYIEITWSVKNKKPEIIPEGGWLCFPFAIKDPVYRISHVSAPFSPEKDLVAGTNAHLFSIDYGILVRNGATGSGMAVASSDLPLWSLSEPGLWKFSQKYTSGKPELFANLYNNQWNTNYPLWIDGTWSASVKVWPVNEGSDEEQALFTPAWEYRQPLLSVFSDGKGGQLPPVMKGITLSVTGTRITAFCPDPNPGNDRKGTLLRLWEQSGKSGEADISLPEGFKAESARPVNLRGQVSGEAIKISGGKFRVHLDAYAPASFIIN